jgi:TolA-binding protein
VDTSGPVSVEATFLLAETLSAIDRLKTILDQNPKGYRDRALRLYRQLSASGQKSDFADDAAFRAIEIQQDARDTAAARARIAAYDQFAKTYPASDRLAEASLLQADAHLILGRTIPSHVDLALESYQNIVRADKSPGLAEKAGYGIGRCLAIKKDYVSAENSLRDFLFEHPNSSLGGEARFQLGLILLERGYLRSAATEFAELLAAPTSVDLEKSSRTLLAECYFRLEDFGGAIRIDESLLARGAEPSVLRRLGEAYTRTGEDEKALSVLGTYVRKFSTTAGADTLAFKRAELLAQLGRTGQAIEAFRGLSTSYPGSALKSDALGSVARLQFGRGNYEAALAAVSGLGTTQDEAIAELRIVTLLRLDRAKQARKEIKTFKKAFPGSNEAVARFEVEEARVQLRYGNPKGARKTLGSVIKKHPGTRASGDAEFYLIEALEKVGKPEEHLAALISFVKNREDNANWSQANLRLAKIHAKDQDYVGASRAYLNALNGQLDDSDRPEVLELLYDSHRNLRSYDSAITIARNLIEQYPHHALSQTARVKIGEIYNEKGAYQEAIDELLPQLTKLQDDPWSSAQNVIAESYQKMGDYESALREYLKLIYNHQGSVNWLANAFMGRARCFTALGRTQEAIEELRKIKARFGGTSFEQQADEMIKQLS